MRVGVTGTRDGPTPWQRDLLCWLLTQYPDVTLLHGDCVGTDALAHDAAEALGLPIEIFPPVDASRRAFKKALIVHPPKPYRERNRDIVNSSDLLLAVVPGPESQFPRSGTWMTVRMARKVGLVHVIIWPEPQPGQAGALPGREE